MPKGSNHIIREHCNVCGHGKFLANGPKKCSRCGNPPMNLVRAKDRQGKEILKLVEVKNVRMSSVPKEIHS